MSKQKIEAGILGEFKKLLSTAAKGLDKLCNSFANDTELKYVEVSDVKEDDDGTVTMSVVLQNTAVGDDDDSVAIFEMKPEDKGYLRVFVECSDEGVDKTELGVVANEDERDKLIIKWLKENNYTGVKSAKSVKVSLQRVTANDGININLTKIYANYPIIAAMGCVDIALANEDFINMIGDEPKCFEIIEDDTDELDVNEVPDFDASESCIQLLAAAVCLQDNLRTLHWNAKGPDFGGIHNDTYNLICTIRCHIDIFGELCVELLGYAPNPGQICDSCGYIGGDSITDANQCLEFIKTELDKYIDILISLQVNFSHDVQTQLDGFIRDLSRESKYKLKQRLL